MQWFGPSVLGKGCARRFGGLAFYPRSRYQKSTGLRSRGPVFLCLALAALL